MKTFIKILFFASVTLGVIFLAVYFFKEQRVELETKQEEVVAPEKAKETDNTLYNEEYKIHIVKINDDEANIKLKHDSKNPKFVSGWIREEDALAIINGGFFHEDFTPSGYLVSDGERVGSRLFDQDRSGLAGMKDGKFFIQDLSAEPLAGGEEFDWAIQSYPFLIKDGRPAVLEDSGLEARRSAVGIDVSGFIYFILADSANISLYEFSKAIDELEIDFVSVLNLDGGPSSGLISTFAGQEIRQDSLAPVPSVILIIDSANMPKGSQEGGQGAPR